MQSVKKEEKKKEDKKISKLDDFVLCFVTINNSKVIMPIEGEDGKKITKEEDIIKVLSSASNHKFFETKKLEIKKYKEAIDWMNKK